MLALLAIADVASEQGRDAWPSPEHLAAKTRMTPRAMRLILHKLERDGELVIELNVERRVVRTGFTPPFFLHIRCVFDLEGYESLKPEEISETAFPSGRRPIGRDFRKNEVDNRKRFRDKWKSGVPQSEKPGTAYKEDPLVDPLDELKQGADTRASLQNDDDDPEKNLNVITVIAHEVFAELGIKADLSDVADAVKTLCSKRAIAYWPGDVIRRAVDSAYWQRTHPAAGAGR